MGVRGVVVCTVVGITLAAPVQLSGQRRSGIAHEITHVVQQHGSRSAVLSLAGGARLVLPPGRADGARLTFRETSAASMPCRYPGLSQLGDTLVIEGTLRGTRGGVRVSIAASPGRRPPNGRLVLVAEREPERASVGGNQTETIGANRTLTVGGRSATQTDGEYYVTSARHRVRDGRIEAELAVDGRLRSLHFGWLERRTAATR